MHETFLHGSFDNHHNNHQKNGDFFGNKQITALKTQYYYFILLMTALTIFPSEMPKANKTCLVVMMLQAP